MDYMDIVVYVMAGILGLCIGSFLNVVIYRVPEGMSIASPPSHCPKCGYRLKWYDNIPVISYLFLGGKCRSCKTHISFRYTLVELLNGALTLLSVILFWKESIVYAILCALICPVLICIFFIDLEHSLIFNVFLWIYGGLAVAAVIFDPSKAILPTLLSSAIGGAAAFAVFFGLRLVFTKIAGKEALGDGDVFLAVISGVLLGWERFLLAMLITSISGSVILLILRKKHGDEKDHEYPFAPYICAGVTVALLFGRQIISFYTSLIGV